MNFIYRLSTVAAILLAPSTINSSFANAYTTSVEEGYYIADPARIHLKAIQSNPELTIDHLSKAGFEVYGPKGLGEYLQQFNIPFVRAEISVSSDRAAKYPSYTAITKALKNLESKYSKIMKLTSIGKTVQGRDLWVMKVSDRPEVDEVEPEVKYISSMHGDEITGRELMISLLDEIGSKYGSDQKITQLVNSTEIFIMPSMNPDGSELIQRGNAKFVDLNRNFPDFSTTDNLDSPDGRAPETQAIMNWQSTRQISLSANFHGGAEVVNYAWDTIPQDHPFKDLLVQVSLEYAAQVPYISQSTEFKNGITNGFEWYEVNGGMQDWSYYWYNDLQFTIELSMTKYPDYSKIPGYYEENRDALIGFLDAVHQGVGFSLTTPELNGKVTIDHIVNGSKHNLGTFGFVRSEFYKVLEPGTYTFTVETEDGHRAQFKNQTGSGYTNLSL